jgi:hypothetical protein
MTVEIVMVLLVYKKEYQFVRHFLDTSCGSKFMDSKNW